MRKNKHKSLMKYKNPDLKSVQNSIALLEIACKNAKEDNVNYGFEPIHRCDNDRNSQPLDFLSQKNRTH